MANKFKLKLKPMKFKFPKTNLGSSTRNAISGIARVTGNVLGGVARGTANVAKGTAHTLFGKRERPWGENVRMKGLSGFRAPGGGWKPPALERPGKMKGIDIDTKTGELKEIRTGVGDVTRSLFGLGKDSASQFKQSVDMYKLRQGVKSQLMSVERFGLERRKVAAMEQRLKKAPPEKLQITGYTPGAELIEKAKVEQMARKISLEEKKFEAKAPKLEAPKLPKGFALIEGTGVE